MTCPHGRRRSMLVALILSLLGVAHAPLAQTTCSPTPPDMEGPFYRANAPERASTGRGVVVSGVVRSSAGCRPLAGARIEWWSANSRGAYDDQHRAVLRSDDAGRYRYETDVPGRYPGRPPHLHLRVAAPGHRTLVTQLYPAPGQTALVGDLVLVPE